MEALKEILGAFAAVVLGTILVDLTLQPNGILSFTNSFLPSQNTPPAAAPAASSSGSAVTGSGVAFTQPVVMS
jgi:hypothetical protein